jgi:hypothetical protein
LLKDDATAIAKCNFMTGIALNPRIKSRPTDAYGIAMGDDGDDAALFVPSLNAHVAVYPAKRHAMLAVVGADLAPREAVACGVLAVSRQRFNIP